MNYEDPTYYILNKKEDFESGYLHNIKLTDNGIKVEDNNKGEGVFISDIYDSYEMLTVWNRMVMEHDGEGLIKFTYYMCEERELIKEKLSDNSISLQEINSFIKPFKVKTVVNAFDIMLNDASGRYFLFKVEILNLKEKESVIKSIRIEFAIQSFLRYLPEIYQEDEASRKFLEGFLGIFQSLYMDIEKKIDKISSYFDPDSTNREFLDWLCNWVKIENSYIWSENKLRYFLKNAVKLYEKIGTVEGISDIVELYASEKPYIVEYFQIKKFLNLKSQYDVLSRLYSDNPYEFIVILSEKSIPTEKEYKEVYKLISEFKPAHTEFKLVILKPDIFLGGYSYLGINSCLSETRNIQLDGTAVIPFIKLES